MLTPPDVLDKPKGADEGLLAPVVFNRPALKPKKEFGWPCSLDRHGTEEGVEAARRIGCSRIVAEERILFPVVLAAPAPCPKSVRPRRSDETQPVQVILRRVNDPPHPRLKPGVVVPTPTLHTAIPHLLDKILRKGQRATGSIDKGARASLIPTQLSTHPVAGAPPLRSHSAPLPLILSCCKRQPRA